VSFWFLSTVLLPLLSWFMRSLPLWRPWLLFSLLGRSAPSHRSSAFHTLQGSFTFLSAFPAGRLPTSLKSWENSYRFICCLSRLFAGLTPFVVLARLLALYEWSFSLALDQGNLGKLVCCLSCLRTWSFPARCGHNHSQLDWKCRHHLRQNPNFLFLSLQVSIHTCGLPHLAL